MAKRILPFWSQIMLLITCASAHASGGFFDSHEILDVTLTGPLKATIADTEDRRQRPFVFSVDGVDLDVAVRVRGKSRVEFCQFPPLRIRFPDNGQGALKLVTHCRKGEAFQENVLEEYAVYRVLGLLSDIAFRVRLLRIRYVDTEKGGRDDEYHYGFLIESADALAERVQGRIEELPGVYLSRLDRNYAGLTFVFQYLVGNTDWGLVTPEDADHCCHNGVVIDIAGRWHVVPYDFDQSGVVNAKYARPDPDLRLRNVRSRLYRGYCIDGLDLKAAVQVTADHEGQILDVMRNLPSSSDRLTRARTDYLQDFFDRAQDSTKLAAGFQKRCIG